MEQFDLLNKALSSFVALTVEEKQDISNIAEVRQVEKGDFFAKEGLVCKHVGFLVKGIFRVYHIHEGKAISNYFNTPARNPFVSSFGSFLTQKPSNEYVEALEDTEVVIISKGQLEGLYAKSHHFEKLGRLMAEYNYLLSMHRIESLQYQSAMQRYENFLEIYPNLINLIPNHYIASYLGITPESLSRIRGQMIGEA